MMKRLFALLLAALLFLCGCSAPVTNSTSTAETASRFFVVVDFYGINDLHGKLDDGDRHPGVDEMTTYLRNAVKNNDHTVLLSAGDMWQGSSESNMTRGHIITDWMNELNFAGMAVGNHEFDWGEDPVASNAERAEFPMLAINIYDRDTDQQVSYCQSSVVVERGGIQIGIIGAIGDCYSSIAPERVEGVYFKTGQELTDLVKAESTKLRSEGVDFIVYSLHDGLGESYGKKLSTVSSNDLRSYYDTSLSDGYVDLVFEAHTHQQYLLRDEYGVCHLQSGGDNQGISHAKFIIDTVTGESQLITAELLTSDTYSNLDDDPLIDTLLERYREQIAPALEVVGTNAVNRSRNEMRQLVADLYLDAGVERWGEEYDIVLGGGFISIRSPGYLAAGEVTYSMLQSLFPFDNELVLCSIQGRDLLSRFFETDNSNYFISYDSYGQQVRGNIDPEATYYVIVDSYSSTYVPNKLTEIQRYGADVFARDLLAQYIKNGGMN